MIIDLVTKFVGQELMPLEPGILEREIKGQHLHLTPDEDKKLSEKCKELGLWTLDATEAFGGMNLPSVTLMAINEEIGRTITPFTFPPDSPNLHMLMATATKSQRIKYLEPYAKGTAKSAIAISEPQARGDPTGMLTRAEKDGEQWVLTNWRLRIAVYRRKISWVRSVPALPPCSCD